MAESMGSAAIARDLRDLIDKRVMQVVDQHRPPYQYATVESLDADGRTAWLLFVGSTNAVPVKYGSVAPTAVGQVVRVDGRSGDRFIVDVIGGGSLVDVVPVDLPAIAGLTVSDGPTSLYIDWTANASPRYEVNVADDAAFTTNNRIYLTQSNALTVDTLNTGTTYYVRVRSRNSSTGGGAWSGTVTGTPTATGIPPTDGIAPTSSPAPVVTGGIAMISAEWVQATGTVDTVTYEVHLSTTSGFTPDANTLLLETTSRFASTQQMPDGTSLATLYGTNIFVRLIAKDTDGAAPVGAQGFAAPIKVETGDVGTIQIGQVSDLAAPTSSPAVTLASGVSYLFAAWDAVTNADALTYEVHLSTTSGFTPNANTLVGATPSLFFFITNESVQIDPLTPVVSFGTVYYCKVVATDIDGSAPAGTQDTASPVNPATVDNTTVEAVAIRSDRYGTVMPQLAIGELSALNANLTHLVSATAEIWSANIQNLAVGTAQIADLAVANGKIGNLQVDDAKISDLNVNKLTAGTIGAHTIILGGASSIIQSSNFVTGPSGAGWRITGDGSLEINTGTFRGALEANTINIPDTTTTNSWHVDATGRMWSGGTTFGAAKFSVGNDGGLLISNGLFFAGSGGMGTSSGGPVSVWGGFNFDESYYAVGNTKPITMTSLDQTMMGDGSLTMTTVEVNNGGLWITDTGVVTLSGPTNPNLGNDGGFADPTIKLERITDYLGTQGEITNTLYTRVRITAAETIVSDGLTVGTSVAFGGAPGGSIGYNVANGTVDINTGSATELQVGTAGTIFSPQGADGGTFVGSVFGNTYSGMRTSGMTASEYMIMSEGTNTFISGGAGGGTHLRNGNNGDREVVCGSNYVDINVATVLTARASTVGMTVKRSATTSATGFADIGFGLLGTYSSRRRLKNNIRNVSSEAACNRIKALQPVEFVFRPEVIGDGKNALVAFDGQRGFIAEDVAKVDHTLAVWDWVDPDNPDFMHPLIDPPDGQTDEEWKAENLKVEDAVPTMWNEHAMIADLVTVVKDLLSRIEHLETL